MGVDRTVRVQAHRRGREHVPDRVPLHDARGAAERPAAPPDEELRHIISVRDTYYGFLAKVPVPLSEANLKLYGVSSTPTLAILDRQGIVRLYHPGRMTEGELDAKIRPLLK